MLPTSYLFVTPADASVTIAAASMQWRLLHRIFVRQHVASHAADIVLLIGILASEAILFDALLHGSSTEWKTVALPLAVTGFVSLCIHTFFRLRCVCVIAAVDQALCYPP